MKKQVFLLFAAILFCQAAFAYNFSFSSVAPSGQTLYYEIIGDGIVSVVNPSSNWSGYTKPTGNLVIPENVTNNGVIYRITRIGQSAFYQCTGLASVTIGNSVTSIQDYAFQGCGLTSVTIGDSVTRIGNSAFGYCTGLTSVTFNADSCASAGSYGGYDYRAFSGCSNITSFSFGNSVRYIPNYLCLEMTGLTSLTIPNSVTSIGNYAFYCCTGLTSVVFNADSCISAGDTISNRAFNGCLNITSFTFGNNVRYIPNYLCLGMTGLTSLTIPNSVTNIGNYAFGNCTGLTSVVFNADSCISAGCGTLGNSAFVNCSNIANFTFGNNVRYIPAYSCYNMTGLTSVTIPYSVTSIGHHAFCCCTGLTSVTIPNSVTSIGATAFSGCTGLTSVTIPNSVTSIGAGAFGVCTGLTSVTIPNSVTSIGNSAFRGCTGLTSVVFNADSCVSAGEEINNRAFEICTNITSFSFGNNVRYIPDYLCLGLTGLTSVIIPNSVTGIGDAAFKNCSGLTSVTFNADSCTTAGRTYYNVYGYDINTAFGNCSNITSFTFGNNVKIIPTYLCFELTGLTSVTIPNSVTSIGHSAFSGCSGLTSVTIPDSVTSIGEYVFSGCTGLISVTIGNSSIGNYAFNNCTGLTSVTIGNSVTRIGDAAFSNCTGLTSMTIPNSVASIGASAFNSCTGLTSVTIGNSVTSIGNFAFYGCSGLTSLTIPNSVTSIGNSACGDCMGLTSVVFNADSCISAGDTVSNRAFNGCPNITSFTFGNNVRYIPNYLCCGMYRLTSVTIPNSVTSIGDNAFQGSHITSVTIGRSVANIGNGAFYTCNRLTSMTFLNPIPPQCGSTTFEFVNVNIPIYIPCGSLALYTEQIPYFTNYVEKWLGIFSTLSDDESMGTVRVLTAPSCTDHNAVLSAVPANGYRFDHWSTGSTDNPYTLTVTSDTTITAFFVEYTPETYNVTVTVDNPATGSVTGGGVYEEGSSVTITAYPADGYHFDHWSTGSTDNPYTLTVTSDTTVIAYFVSNGGTEGIGDVDGKNIQIIVSNGCIVVEGVEQKDIQVYDITGRITDNRALPSGVYIVKIGQLPARKVVVLR